MLTPPAGLWSRGDVILPELSAGQCMLAASVSTC